MTRMRWLTMAGIAGAGLLAAAPARAGSGDEKRSTGTVQRLDASSGKITLANGPANLTVTDETQIRKDGRRAMLSEVREGDEVRASYSGSGDTLKVNKLEVISAKDPFYHPSHDSP